MQLLIFCLIARSSETRSRTATTYSRAGSRPSLPKSFSLLLQPTSPPTTIPSPHILHHCTFLRLLDHQFCACRRLHTRPTREPHPCPCVTSTTFLPSPPRELRTVFTCSYLPNHLAPRAPRSPCLPLMRCHVDHPRRSLLNINSSISIYYSSRLSVWLSSGSRCRTRRSLLPFSCSSYSSLQGAKSEAWASDLLTLLLLPTSPVCVMANPKRVLSIHVRLERANRDPLLIGLQHPNPLLRACLRLDQSWPAPTPSPSGRLQQEQHGPVHG